ncbi:hypothetical protein BOTBODRAFT_36837 [Botryobasidium botryosum FD-172 SS1]|uniref:F-box domain-containing protein n=1 Tax=Botryobasidium botryosum (strain FD-172 SS1) TaxID=930990 RepID=A0A067M2F7_BOTB1|nr:hypothetical protein BOTBODRAFT_36837 [Botryobasidium botryosum FD-172 SS1]
MTSTQRNERDPNSYHVLIAFSQIFTLYLVQKLGPICYVIWRRSMPEVLAIVEQGPRIITWKPVRKISISWARALSNSNSSPRCPVHRLPIEILHIIFTFVKDTSINLFQPRLETKAPFNLSHVCRRWRDAALCGVALWTKIDAVNFTLIDLFLARSKSAPLDIELYEFDQRWFDAGYASTPDEDGTAVVEGLRRAFFFIQKARVQETSLFLQPLLPHVYRWKSLKLPYISGSKVRFMLKSRAPQLEVFHFGCSSLWNEIYGLGSGLFGGYTPRLRDVRLGGVYVSLDPNFACLKTLCLRNLDYRLVLAQIFINTLQGCPLLEELALQYIQFSQSEGEATLRPDHPSPALKARAAFPSLRYLLLENLGKLPTHAILASIVTPPSLHLCVDMHRATDLHDVFPQNISNLPNLARLRSLWVESEDGWCFLYGSSAPRIVPPGKNEPRLLTIGLGGLNTQHIPVMGPLLRDLSHILPMPDIEALYINVNEYPYSADALAAALHNFPKLRLLTLSLCPPSALRALSTSNASLPCPLLDTLELHSCAVNGGSLKEVLDSRRIAARAEQGPYAAPLRTLVLSGPGATSSALSDLRYLGVEVRFVPAIPSQAPVHLKTRLQFGDQYQDEVTYESDDMYIP